MTGNHWVEALKDVVCRVAVDATVDELKLREPRAKNLDEVHTGATAHDAGTEAHHNVTWFSVLAVEEAIDVAGCPTLHHLRDICRCSGAGKAQSRGNPGAADQHLFHNAPEVVVGDR